MICRLWAPPPPYLTARKPQYAPLGTSGPLSALQLLNLEHRGQLQALPGSIDELLAAQLLILWKCRELQVLLSASCQHCCQSVLSSHNSSFEN